MENNDKITITEQINQNIEIRSTEVQEILGATPSWLIRAGISIILGVVIVILIGSWFFKYPDVITSKITLTTENPPAVLKALSNGKISELFYSEKQTVQSGSVIAIIENTANYRHIQYLKTVTDTIKNITTYNDSLNLNLGDLQQSYSSFTSLIKGYNNFKSLDYYNEKISSINQQKNDYQLYYKELNKQIKLQEKDIKISQSQFERAKKLFTNGVYSKTEFENAEKTFLQQKLSLQNAHTNITQSKIQVNQLNQQILDLKLQETQEQNRQEIAIREAYKNLISQIQKWEQTYVIKSPISGCVTFTNVWSKNQNVQSGQTVATVIPKNETDIIGKLEIPAMGIGKVKLGQIVNIKFDNFPYMEFGMLKGKIKSISLIPTVTDKGSIYSAEVLFPNKLISNYGKTLAFSQEMTGTAEIITDDTKLLHRFFNPLKSLWKNNID